MFIVSVIEKVKGLLTGALFTLLLLPAEGQLIRVQSLLSTDSLLIGEQMQYTLRVEADGEVEFILPQIKDTLSSSLEVLSLLSSDTIVSDQRKVIERSYLLTVFDPGSHIVPSQEVIYKRGALLDTARSMPLILHVYAPEVDTSMQIKPIKPPINTPVTLKEILPWAGAGLGALLLVGGAVYLLIRYLKRKKYPQEDPQKSLEPAHIIAFRELDRLKNEKIWTKGLVKEYYTSLTEITRRYLERQYGIPAMERTSDEIIHAFRKVNLEDGLLDEMLKELLELADLVKFAREDPLPVDNQTHLNNAYIFVQKTYPRFYSTEEKEEVADE